MSRSAKVGKCSECGQGTYELFAPVQSLISEEEVGSGAFCINEECPSFDEKGARWLGK